ncbi:MAG: hypothetical protein RIS52_1496 [Pseudomonadota bacterium]
MGAVIKLILAGAMALGVLGPMAGFARDGGNQVTIGMVGGGPSWNDANAKIRLVRIAKNAIVFHYSKKVVAVGEKVRPRIGRECCLGLARKCVNRAFCKDGGEPFWDFGAIVNAGPAIYNNGMPDITSFHRDHEGASFIANTTHKIDSNSASLLCFTQKVGLASFMKGRIDQKYTDGAKSHPNQGCNAHYFCPPSGNFLRRKVLFYALVLAGGLLSLVYALSLVRGGKGAASIRYQFLGIFGIMCGGVGCVMFIGIAH